MSNILQYLADQTRYYQNQKDKIEQQRNQPNTRPVDPSIQAQQQPQSDFERNGQSAYSPQEQAQRQADSINQARAKMGLAPLATPERIQQQKMNNEYNALRGLSSLGSDSTPEDIARALMTSDPKSAATILNSQQTLKQNEDRYADQSMYNADRLKSQQEIQTLKNEQTANKMQAPAQQRMQDANEVLQLTKQARPLLDTTTNGLIGNGVDSIAGAFGISTQGAKSAAQLKALEGMLVSKMPKMSGPQSDKDVLLYRQMAGQIGDSSVPVETRKAALDAIEQLNQRYAGGQQAQTAQSNVFDSVPDPRQYAGKVIRDSETGQRLKSDGSSWVRM